MDKSPAPISNTLAAVRDHTRRFQDFDYVYPVISRRSRGLSIGINLNPDKVCNFDCVYCCVDRTTPGKRKDVDLVQLREELRSLVQYALSGGLATEPRFNEVPELTRHIRDLAFSGDGEPTMVHNFAACVRVAVEVKQEFHLPETRIVLITDAAGLDKAGVKAGLEIMDQHQGEIWGKLDAGTESYYQLVNRSAVKFERILANLRETARVRPIIIQSLFLKTHGSPMGVAELHAYCQRLKEIVAAGGQIREVHAYTIARPTPVSWATKLTTAELGQIAESIRRETNLKVEIFD